MATYFFDLTSDDAESVDEEGIELPDAEVAHETALNALMRVAHDAVLEGSMSQRFAVSVRDVSGPVLEIAAEFHSRIFRKQ
jgi:hypothetical protein